MLPSESPRGGASHPAGVTEEESMATTDDVKDALIERMSDPEISASTYNEMQRRLSLLESVEG